MIKYIMTSPTLEGEVEFTYDDHGRLMGLTFQCAASDKQYNYIFTLKPFTLEALQDLIKKTPYATFVKEEYEITFLMFWNRYNEKELSSKKKAETRWNNMPKNQRIKAYNYIPKYKASVPPGVRLKYAETYLNSEIWEK